MLDDYLKNPAKITHNFADFDLPSLEKVCKQANILLKNIAKTEQNNGNPNFIFNGLQHFFLGIDKSFSSIFPVVDAKHTQDNIQGAIVTDPTKEKDLVPYEKVDNKLKSKMPYKEAESLFGELGYKIIGESACELIEKIQAQLTKKQYDNPEDISALLKNYESVWKIKDIKACVTNLHTLVAQLDRQVSSLPLTVLHPLPGLFQYLFQNKDISQLSSDNLLRLVTVTHKFSVNAISKIGNPHDDPGRKMCVAFIELLLFTFNRFPKEPEIIDSTLTSGKQIVEWSNCLNQQQKNEFKKIAKKLKNGYPGAKETNLAAQLYITLTSKWWLIRVGAEFTDDLPSLGPFLNTGVAIACVLAATSFFCGMLCNSQRRKGRQADIWNNIYRGSEAGLFGRTYSRPHVSQQALVENKSFEFG